MQQQLEVVMDYIYKNFQSYPSISSGDIIFERTGPLLGVAFDR